MGFLTAVGRCYTRIVTFSGRARRAEYWWFFLFQILVAMAVQIPFIASMMNEPNFPAMLTQPGGIEAWLTRSPQMTQLVLITSVAWLVLMSLPNLSVTVRRLHDTDRSGWMILMPTLVAALSGFGGGFMAGLGAASGSGGMVIASLFVMTVPSVVASIWFLVLLCLPGTHGPNRFGPDSIAKRKATAPSHPAFARETADPEERAAIAAARRAEAREYYRKNVLPQVRKV